MGCSVGWGGAGMVGDGQSCCLPRVVLSGFERMWSPGGLRPRAWAETQLRSRWHLQLHLQLCLCGHGPEALFLRQWMLSRIWCPQGLTIKGGSGWTGRRKAPSPRLEFLSGHISLSYVSSRVRSAVAAGRADGEVFLPGSSLGVWSDCVCGRGRRSCLRLHRSVYPSGLHRAGVAWQPSVPVLGREWPVKHRLASVKMFRLRRAGTVMNAGPAARCYGSHTREAGADGGGFIQVLAARMMGTLVSEPVCPECRQRFYKEGDGKRTKRPREGFARFSTC